MCHALAGAPLAGMKPAQFARDVLGDSYVAASLDAESLASGGGLVREGIAADFIEALRPRALVRRRVPEFNVYLMPQGNLSINKVTSGTVGRWVGEPPAQGTSTPPAFGKVRMVSKEWQAEFPLSNDLLRNGGPNAERVIRGEVFGASAYAEDAEFIRGLGTVYRPKGLRYWAGTVVAAQASPTIAKVTTDTGLALKAMGAAGSDFLNVSWVFSPQTFVYLGNQRTTDGAKAWPELDRGIFRGLPFDVTPHIPANLGVGQDESEVLLVDWLEVSIGDELSAQVNLSRDAAYWDGAAEQPAFSRDETVLRIIHKTDLAVRRAERVIVISGAAWTV